MRAAALVAALLACGGCRTAAPVATPAPAPVLVQESGHDARILIIGNSFPNDTKLCVEPTAYMLFNDPNLVGNPCGLTVGELRAWLQRLSRAD